MPSSVEIFRVTKLRPGQVTNILASVIFTNSPQSSIVRTNPFRVDSTSTTKFSDAAHQSLIRRVRVANQQQCQNHSNERDQPCHKDDGVKRMSAGGLAGVGKMSDQCEGND